MFFRKIIHALSGLLGIGVLLFPKPIMVAICACGLILAGLVDAIRLRWGFKGLPGPIKRFFKEKEGRTISGSTALLASYLFLVALFPAPVSAFAILFFSVGDPLASFSGKYFPLWRFREKSVGGAIAFLVVGIILSITLPGLSFWIKICAALIGALAEFLARDVDDNLMVPVAVGIVFVALEKLLGQ
ncbi:MAG: diacylglycerol/polyprenol kinase family protein [candidate division WOR-3 bacterium]